MAPDLARTRQESLSLAGFFDPASIAIVGASSDPERIGGLPLRFLRENGYRGRVYPINPTRSEIQGVPAFPSFTSLPERVDLAVIALPGEQAVAALASCAAAGVRCATVFSAGFAEVGGEGAQLQRSMRAIADAHGMRVLGPNCAGAVDFHTGTLASFAPLLKERQPAPGSVALVTQSGAFANYGYLVGLRRGVRFSRFMSTGNEVDVEVAGALIACADDPRTRVILVYLEGCRDGSLLLEALRHARACDKHVVAVKVGRTAAGSRAAASHTASLVGSDDTYEALFRQFAVHRARSIEELFDLGYTLAHGSLPRDGRIALVSVSGGVGVLMADEAASRGLDVATVPALAQQEIKALVPFAATANPIDVTAQTVNDLSLFEKSLDAVLRHGGFSIVLCFLGFMGRSLPFIERLIPLWETLQRRYPDVLLPIVTLFDEAARQRLVSHGGILMYEEPTHAVRAMAALVQASSARAQIRTAASAATRDAESSAEERPADAPVGIADAAIELPLGACLDEPTSLALLRQWGLPCIAFEVVMSEAEAVAATARLRGPVALKVVSSAIPHKHRIGGVRLDLVDAAQVRAAFAAVLEQGRRATDTPVDRVIVQPMAARGVELMLGVKSDPVFGPTVVLAAGGVAVEAERDFSLRVGAIDRTEARRMVGEVSRCRRLMADDLEAIDVEALASALSALSRIAVTQPRIAAIDVNPFIVGRAGTGAIAVDALVETRPASEPTPRLSR